MNNAENRIEKDIEKDIEYLIIFRQKHRVSIVEVTTHGNGMWFE